MEECNFDFNLSTANIENSKFDEINSMLSKEMFNIKESLKTNYETNYASINAPFDSKICEEISSMINLKKKLNIESLVVIGIGGSNLGTLAIHQALFGSFNNENSNNTKIYFPDTVDSDYLQEIIKIIENDVKNGKKFLINVVTKSGTTIETISIFEIFLSILKKYSPNNFKDYIVVTTDKNSKLWDYAIDNDLEKLEIPKNIGGRYSIFTAVGLFPLGFCGIDIRKLLCGAKDMVKKCINIINSKEEQNILSNPAATSAIIIYNNYLNGYNIHDTFIFYKNLNFLGSWYRQLVGESLGKKIDKFSNIIETGITPTISIGTTDLHSVAQLYLGGPRDKFTTFVSVNPRSNIFIPNMKEFYSFNEKIQGKEIIMVMDSIVKGVKAAYKNDNRPFISMHFPKISEYCLGQFMQWKMLETIYIGCLLNVNPFDQPEVELYKKETKRILNL